MPLLYFLWVKIRRFRPLSVVKWLCVITLAGGVSLLVFMGYVSYVGFTFPTQNPVALAVQIVIGAVLIILAGVATYNLFYPMKRS